MAFDFESLTLGEVAFVEDLSGQGIAQIASEDAPKGKALAALATVVKRRTGEPSYTFNQALQLPLSEANALLAGGDEDDAEGKDSPTTAPE